MSFTREVKTELSALKYDDECCKRAYAYGFLIFGKSFSSRSITCASEYGAVIRSFHTALLDAAGVNAATERLKGGKYILRVASPADRKKTLEAFDHSPGEVTLRINHGIFENDACYGAFLRGAFMACGSIANPDKNYHMEFVVSHNKLSLDLLKIITDLDLKAKYILRRYSHVVYLKESESIEDLLTTMGATESTLKLMEIKINKDVKNKINRKMNFESANLSRVIDAGLVQAHAIKLLKDNKALDTLEDSLRELAVLRYENPDMSLKQLGEALSTPLSRSGVNHRLSKIVKLAKQYEK
ncbi:MAG: DNA-binding protein WhiA [Clostridia bacterium]|nr:DNA-binding protein WhiA [Clostridia bacterium]